MRLIRPTFIVAALCLSFCSVSTRAQGLRANSQKYRERDPAAATGRAGSANLSARVLVGQDGASDLEITTGDFDGGSPPGAITKVQIKALDGTGATRATWNYVPVVLQGYWTREYRGLVVGQPIQIQGNVTRLDGRRTDVVSVTTTVLRRPDLVVEAIAAPSRTPVGVPTVIAATVKEANQQVGARADCVLFVDDAEVDRSNGIWVDAGDEVTCAFSYMFSTSGSKALRVAVVNVRPGDWDDSNNAATGSVDVDVPRTGPFSYVYGYAMNYTRLGVYQRFTTSFATSDSLSGSDYENLAETQSPGYESQLLMASVSGQEPQLWFPASVSGEFSDGVTRSTFALNVAAQTGTPGCGNGSTLHETSGSQLWVGVNGCEGGVQVIVERFAGAVTFVSRNFHRIWFRDSTADDPTYVYVYEYFSNGTLGPLPERLTGDRITLDATLLNASGAACRAAAEVSLDQSRERHDERPRTCQVQTVEWGTYTYCEEWSIDESVKWGQVDLHQDQ